MSRYQFAVVLLGFCRVFLFPFITLLALLPFHVPILLDVNFPAFLIRYLFTGS